MNSSMAELALEIALQNSPMLLLCLGNRSAVGIVSRALYEAADMAWISYISVPPEVIDLTLTQNDQSDAEESTLERDEVYSSSEEKLVLF